MSLALAFWASEMLRMPAWSQSAGAGVMNLQFTPDWPVRCVFKFIEMLFSKKPNTAPQRKFVTPKQCFGLEQSGEVQMESMCVVDGEISGFGPENVS